MGFLNKACELNFELISTILNARKCEPRDIVLEFNAEVAINGDLSKLEGRAKLLGLTVKKLGNATIIYCGNLIQIIGKEFKIKADSIFNSHIFYFKKLNTLRFVGNVKLNKLEGLLYNIDANIVDLSGLSFKGIDSIDKMFMGANINKVILDGIDTSSLKSAAGVFESANIASIDLSKFNMSKVVDMESMFAGANINNGNIDISNWELDNVKNMDHMFSVCSHMGNINFGDNELPKLLSTTRMFFGTMAKKISIANSTFERVSKSYCMFYDCSIEELDISKMQLSEDCNTTEMFNCAIINKLKANDKVLSMLGVE